MTNKEKLLEHIKLNGKKINLLLGDFELTKVIGQGGNGIVYEAKLGSKIVAIKFLVTEITGNSKAQKLKRFVAEYFNIITIRSNSHIVKYIDYDILELTGDTPAIQVPTIIMKRYDHSLVELQKKCNVEEFIKLFNFLLNVVDKIHAQGIIHRDIKPENILIDNDELVLADFGIASYNPEIFKLIANTEKRERLGNRLFSSPEQEESGIKAHPTMDIYAIGQVLQWFATGKTHRGTGRQLISQVFKDLDLYDDIIEKCLENNPSNRFQSIQEIRDFIKAKTNAKKDPWWYIELFNESCRKYFPKNETGIVRSKNIPRNDEFFNELLKNEKEFSQNLWWHDGSSNLSMKLQWNGVGRWKINEREYDIKEIWVHYNTSLYNDFVLIHFLKGEAFEVGDEKKFYTVLVDEKYHISYSEYENGYAEIERKIVKLRDHKVEFIERPKEEGYLFIGTRFSCILRRENDKAVREFISSMKQADGELDNDAMMDFVWRISEHKHKDIIDDL